jgi:hypothetical protein
MGLRSAICFLVIWQALSILTCAEADETPLAARYDLRVYGPLLARDVSPVYGYYQQIRLTAQSPTLAGLLLSKFLRDYTALPTVMEQPVTTGHGALQVLVFEGGRRILPVLRTGESSIDLYLFTSPMDLTRFLASSSVDLRDAVNGDARNYPYYFDFWDRHCMGFWYMPNSTVGGKYFTENGNYAFMRHYGLNMNYGYSFSPGAVMSTRYGIGFKFNRWLDTSVSSFDNHPEAENVGDPDITIPAGVYGDVPFAGNPVGLGQMDESNRYLKPFCDNEYLTSIADPHAEIGPQWNGEYYSGSNQRDEYSRQDFIHYLRDLRKLSLTDLGQRWYGQPDHYKQWDEVQFPRERDFYGWQDGQSQDLAGIWKMKIGDLAGGEAAQFAQPGFDDSTWFTFQQPGTAYLDVSAHGAPSPGGWSRCGFTPDPALANSGKPVYLTICPFNNAGKKTPSTIYFNGQKLADLTWGHGLEWGQYEVTSLLRSGMNVLAVHTLMGAVRGPAFLTLKKAAAYPTDDEGLNARFFDLTEWTADVVVRANARDIAFLRSIDPVRPVKIMAPDNLIDGMMPVTAELGAYPHCTGEGGFFRPWLKRYGYLRGVAASAEPPSSAKDVAGLKGLFFAMTLEGVNACDYFYHLQDILGDSDKKSWYEKNLPYFELMGAYDLKKPEIAIARSARNLRIFPQNSAQENDPGRGDLQEAHQTYVYCSERDFADHLLDSYKVVMDDNFHTLEPGDVDNLQAYVEKGGTLILNQRSGRSTYLKPNSWPIAKLIGCTPVIRPQTGSITFDANPVILKAYAGKTLANHGESVDWQGLNYFDDSISLDATGPDVSVVARYDDGKPAIIVRTVGKGRVIVLGSAFYRKTSDVKGYYIASADNLTFYDDLLADLGIPPVVQSGQSTLWAERFISNSGSTEMLVLGNQDPDAPLHGASAVWDLGFKPARVFDPANGSDIPVQINGSRVTISGLDLGPRDLRYFAVERSDWTPAETVKHWLSRQSDLWHAITIPAAQPPVDPLRALRFPGDYAVKQFGDAATARKALAIDFSTDPTWQTLHQSDWIAAGLATGQNLWGVYRATLDIDPGWLKNLRGVELSYQQGRYISMGEMAINGTLIARNEADAATPAQILTALKPGRNLITFLIRNTPDGDGGFYSNFALRRLPAGQEIDLSSDWTGYDKEVASSKVNFPAQGEWIFLRKMWTLPEAARDHSVWIEVEGSAGVVSVNGRVLNAGNRSGGNYSVRGGLRVNITAALHKSGPNEIALGTSSWPYGSFSAAKMDVHSVKLFFVPRS